MSGGLKQSIFKLESKKISHQILEWSFSKERYLNIISPPYISTDIFVELILNFIKQSKKVLYITNENDSDVEIIEKIKKESKFRGYTYLKQNSKFEESLLIIAKHEMVDKLNCKFDLVIYDEIKNFSEYTAYEIIDIMNSKAHDDTKLVTCFIEKIFENKRGIVLPVRNNVYPLIEPKFISTRVDINKDIPYVIYEYLEWSLKINSQKVVIYVPSEDKVDKVYKYLALYCNKMNKNILSFVENKSNKKILNNFLKMKEGLLVTNDFYSDISNSNVMVFFADDTVFDYKKLVYISGKVGKKEKNPKGEVIFLGNCETEDIDKARNITRNFNKEAWEMDLLRI
ncbi:hypothetical protein RBU49_12345 [Clostridium sp. MB40-C1]|uniref:hypothetical protein n=1 Tax=Clostridium sp. MB40-C1 TaxID=3070996 RepID=UPI0027E20F74|nr:hypothetical protein [Clostridium sp. MB40-C1]WMJ79658.1 hypothetical protein RBU49_12345 [Clostridium sp. MB40-C1]